MIIIIYYFTFSIQNESRITDDDLLRITGCFKPENVTKFVMVYDDDSGYLQSTLDKYHNSDTQTKAFHVLRAMLKKKPNITRENFQKSYSIYSLMKQLKSETLP